MDVYLNLNVYIGDEINQQQSLYQHQPQDQQNFLQQQPGVGQVYYEQPTSSPYHLPQPTIKLDLATTPTAGTPSPANNRRQVGDILDLILLVKFCQKQPRKKGFILVFDFEPITYTIIS